ncbi:MAG: hypothetical protein JW797_20545 [Bradymonadales bacterium]|nr:hypothetical protein [Bradymonadales bacterium]
MRTMFLFIAIAGTVLGCSEGTFPGSEGETPGCIESVAGQSLSWMRGHVWTVDSSGRGDFTDIQTAVDAASDGDTILVAPGTYDGAVITKRLELVGDGAGVYITEGYLDNGFYLMGHGADGSVIRNFSFDGIPFPVFGEEVDDVTVTRLRINDFIEGIGVYGGNRWKIIDNLLTASAQVSEDWQMNGITLAVWEGAANDNVVAFNTIRYTGQTPTGYFYGNWGIHLAAFPETVMEGNIIFRNRIRFVTGQWFSGGIGIGDASIFYGGPPVVTDNYIGYNDARGSTTWEIMFLSVSLEDNQISCNRGETWYTLNPYLGDGGYIYIEPEPECIRPPVIPGVTAVFRSQERLDLRR